MINTIECLTIAAIIIGPILSLQIQKMLEDYKEKKDRKLNIFKTLMRTRGTRLSPEHVNALNMIDIEFIKYRDITNAWKSYLDILSSTNFETKMDLWIMERDKLFVELLTNIGTQVGYDFDKVYLSKSIYTPKAYGEEEQYQYWVRDQLKKVFCGDQPISIKIEK